MLGQIKGDFCVFDLGMYKIEFGKIMAPIACRYIHITVIKHFLTNTMCLLLAPHSLLLGVSTPWGSVAHINSLLIFDTHIIGHQSSMSNVSSIASLNS